MKCPKCGLENEFGKENCTNCGENLKKNIRSNNGFDEVDLEVLQPQTPMVEQPTPAVQQPAPEQPVMMPLNPGQTPPAIGQILEGVSQTETTKTPVFTPIDGQPQQPVPQPQTQSVAQTTTPQPTITEQQPEPPKEEQSAQPQQILEPMHKQKNPINWKDRGLLAILGCGIIAFAIIGTLITMSISSVNKSTKTKTEVQYREILGEWIDNSKTNLFVISNNSYTWYQDFSNDKSNLTSGEVKVLSGKKALGYLDITKSTAEQLLNIVDESDVKEFYSLKLFTSAKDHNHAYYKMLFYVKEDGIICYNFNDKKLYFLYKNN
ncbi:MAG: hypothetical protein IJ193_07695 [Bacilli bacterium]|nr:hypothetical protein [Bacilli bacterium]